MESGNIHSTTEATPQLIKVLERSERRGVSACARFSPIGGKRIDYGLPVGWLFIRSSPVMWLRVVALLLTFGRCSSSDKLIAAKTNCGPEQFPCGNTSVCLDRHYHCDGEFHCENGEDEMHCDDIYGSMSSLMKGLRRRPIDNFLFYPHFYNCSMDNLPDGCGCRAFTWVFCISLNLTRVPDTMKSSLTKLILINNSITIVERGSFSRYPGLKVIHLEGNGLRYLHEGAFTGLFNLVFLFLSRNKIEKLNGGTFKDLKKLEWLLLDDNKLEEFDFSILADTPSLHLLDLSTNSLTLKKVYFRAHPYLRWL
ncbi:relaxin receptor 2-like [Centruroides sculpturatus]|uniref:relaxin receptor 2-like n=1 Tax=Centruroides sculpturatus TaxID=218467 RepID=UPI000C6DD186|nr:relaxin receptor 2-like [Centruroides sculpturatus]